MALIYTYNINVLMKIMQIEVRRGIQRAGSQEEYYEALNRFVDEVPLLFEEYLPSSIPFRNDEIRDKVTILQGYLIAINAVTLPWQIERLSKLLELKSHGKTREVFQKVRRDTTELVYRIKEARIRMIDIPEEQRLDQPEEIFAKSGDKQPVTEIKREMFYKLKKFIENYEFSHALTELEEMERFSFGGKIDWLLDAMGKNLAAFNIEEIERNMSELVSLIDDIDAKRQSGKRLLIMAVDDVPGVLVTLKAMLRQKYTVVGMTEPEDALLFLTTQTPDLIFLDIEMPGMDGYTLLNLIRKMPIYEKTPIVFLTGNATKEHFVRAMEAGANGFIKKPVDYQLLNEKIEEITGIEE